METNLESSIAPANWPKTSREHKVVQIYVSENPYLRFLEKSKVENHKSILIDSLDRFGIEYDFLTALEHGPALSGDRYKVAGMGWADVDLANKTAKFFGLSAGYGIGISADHIEAIRPLLLDWRLIIGDVTRRPKIPY